MSFRGCKTQNLWYNKLTEPYRRNEVKMMKKVLCLLCAVCAAVMNLCIACASPLTGDTSNMGLWIAMVVVAVIAVVVLLIVGAKKKKK